MSSMLTIENNRENHPIFNQIYDIQAELHNQGKKITLCKVLAHIRIKGNEEADKAAKQVIGMPGNGSIQTIKRAIDRRLFEYH